MNLDFHVHGLLSKKSNFNEGLFLQGIENAKDQGLDGFILCEHFNAKDILSIYKYLEDNYRYIGDKYIVNGFSIFLGMEVDIKNGGHVIVSGNRKDILEVRKYLDKYSEKPNFIPFEELLELGERFNLLMVGSHPYREDHKLFLQPKGLLSRLDALDLNATDIFKRGLEVVENEVERLSKEINVPYVTGSDSHYPIQLGSVLTNLYGDLNTVQDIKDVIKSEEYTINISKALDLKVFSAKSIKEDIKSKIEQLQVI